MLLFVANFLIVAGCSMGIALFFVIGISNLTFKDMKDGFVASMSLALIGMSAAIVHYINNMPIG